MLYILHIHICVHLYTERSSRTYTSSLILINFKYLLSKQNVPNFNEIPAIISSVFSRYIYVSFYNISSYYFNLNFFTLDEH